VPVVETSCRSSEWQAEELGRRIENRSGWLAGFHLLSDEMHGEAPADFLETALKVEAWPEHRRSLAAGLGEEEWARVARAYATVRIIVPAIASAGLNTDKAREYATPTVRPLNSAIDGLGGERWIDRPLSV
jgi:hypothetical protein